MDTFAELDRFLSNFAPEVSGRSTGTVTPELAGQIESFRSGDLDDESARELSRELLANRDALAHLASLLQK